MAHYVVYDSATGALVSEGATDPGAPGAGKTAHRYEADPSPTAVWSPALRDYAEVAEGVPIGALRYVLDPADPLGLPVDVIRATDPDPAAPKSAVPLTTQPRSTDEWTGTAFAPSTRVSDRLVHGLLKDLLAEAQLHQWAADNSVARGDPADVRAQLAGLAARSWRKVRLTLKGQALLP